jgi:hypothetical protein
LAQAKVQGFAEVLSAKDAEDGISALYVVFLIFRFQFDVMIFM